MARTAGQIVALVDHALGSNQPASIDLWEILNSAGRAMFGEHSWSWRVAGPLKIAATGGTNTIALPEDFGELVGVQAQISPYMINVTTVADINRATAIVTSSPYAAMIAFDSWTIPTSPTQRPQPQALLWPIPTETGKPTLVISYMRRWRDMVSTDPNAVPNIPAEWDMALIYRARAEAKALVNDDAGSSDMAMYQKEIERLKLLDGAKQVNYGKLRGGASRFDVNNQFTPANWVALFPKG